MYDSFANDQEKNDIISSICSYLKLYDDKNSTEYLTAFKEKYSENTADFERMSGIRIILGNENDNVLSGTAKKEILEGGAGNDILNGNAGSDILDGGAGNDQGPVPGKDAGQFAHAC